MNEWMGSENTLNENYTMVYLIKAIWNTTENGIDCKSLMYIVADPIIVSSCKPFT